MSGKERDEADALGDALAMLVHAGQAARHVARGRAIGLAKEALGTAAKVVAALEDF